MIDLSSYSREGYAIVASSEVARLKERLSASLVERALAVLAKEPDFRDHVGTLSGCPFCDIVDYVVSRESDRSVSARLYRLLGATPEFLAAIADPFVLDCVRALGLGVPLAGTLPQLRLDRPGDEFHRTPAHQDWWFSLLSPNCLTFWFHLGRLDNAMGLLEVAPGSHRGGSIPFRQNLGNNNPLRPAEDWPEDAFRAIPLGDDEFLIFSQMLLHRSGLNRSSRTRISIQLRYNDIATMERPESSYAVTHSAYVQETQARLMGEP